MRHPKLIACAPDERLDSFLGTIAKERKWAFRSCRGPEAIVRCLEDDGPAVVLVRVSPDRVEEAWTLDQVKSLFPKVVVVALADTDDWGLLGLLWDLGADFVVAAPWTPPQLKDVLEASMVAEDPASSAPAHDE